MIPLNRPFVIRETRRYNCDLNSDLKERFPQKESKLVFSARVGLDIVYNYLYKRYGKLNVLVSPLTCFDALDPIAKNGHEVVFSDISLLTFNLSELTIEGSYDVLQAIHLGGNPQNMPYLYNEISNKGRILVEDCAQALGAKVNGIEVGSWGNFSVFSLMKNLHALAGGILLSEPGLPLSDDGESDLQLTKTAVTYRQIKRFLEGNSTNNSTFTSLLNKLLKLIKNKKNPEFRNYVLPPEVIRDANNQLSGFQTILEKRIEISKKIISNLVNYGYVFQSNLENHEASYTRIYMYHERINNQYIIKRLREYGIGANHIVQDILATRQVSIQEHPLYKKYYIAGKLPNYDFIYDKIFTIPISAGLKSKEVDYICEKLIGIVNDL